MKSPELYMNIAKLVSQESYCVRKKVGAVLLTKEGIMSIGYNGGVSKGVVYIL